MEKKNNTVQNMISDNDLEQVTGGNGTDSSIFLLDNTLDNLRGSTADAMEVLRNKYNAEKENS